MQLAPPPWTLRGNGVVLVAHFPEPFVRKQGFLAPYQQSAYRGWVGAVMLVDYATSGVGPYRELLFIPGLFNFGAGATFSISKIYVSTDESVQNGIRNWGIPKELADFDVAPQPDGSTTYRATLPGESEPFFLVNVAPFGPRFPITTKLLPSFRVTQQHETGLLRTDPTAHGQARLARLRGLQQNAAAPANPLFPDLKQGRILATLAVENFQMVFPVPQTLTTT